MCFVTYRAKTFVSLLGDIRFGRGYYHCEHCGQGHFPWDKSLRLSAERLTPAAAEVITLSGLKESFGQVADRSLYKQTGLRLSESTVERVTETAGERLDQLWEKGVLLGESRPWDWHRDRSGQTCGYVSVDATGIMMQGPAGAQAEGRMVNVGLVYNPQPHPVTRTTRWPNRATACVIRPGCSRWINWASACVSKPPKSA